MDERGNGDGFIHPNGQIDRRRLLQAMGAVGLGIVTVPGIVRPAAAADRLTVLTWSGYDIDEVSPEFVGKHGKPDYALMGSDEEGFQKMRAGFKPDLASHNSYMIGRLHDAGLIKPIDTSRLTHWNDVYPEIRDVEKLDGQAWMAPFSWGNTSVLYRKDMVELKEDSYSLLWDERYAGRIAARDAVEASVVAAGLYTGAADPWNMTDAELAVVKDALLKQKPLVRFYWTSQTELEQSFASGEVVAALGWNSSVASLQKQGIDMVFMRPKEGMITWTDGLVLLKDHPAPEELAYDFMNSYMSPEVGRYLIETFGYGSANAKAFDGVKPEALAQLGITDPAGVVATSRFAKEISADIRQKYQDVWDTVKFSG